MPAIHTRCQREVSVCPLQDTLETSMCARNTLPACYGPVKGTPTPLLIGRINSLE